MAAEQLHSMFRKGKEGFEKITTLIYQTERLTLLNVICDPKEAEILYSRTKKSTPVIDKDTVILQECMLIYPKHIRLKLRQRDELRPTKRATMVGLYLQRMYPANATEVIKMVNAATDGEKKWLAETQGGLQLWLQNKGIVNVYVPPSEYRL